jgi:two-component system, chemotaxis family, chemotaxis protein CheY
MPLPRTGTTSPAELKFLAADGFSTMLRIVRGLPREMGRDDIGEGRDDGQTAPNMLKTGSFDPVVRDINMPALNGFELPSAIKADAALKRIRVPMLTARRDDIVRAAQSGAARRFIEPLA